MTEPSADMDPLAAALDAFVNGPEDDLRRIVEAHWSALNSDDADVYLAGVLTDYAGQSDVVAHLRDRRELLYRCRTEGIYSAFSSEPEFDPRIGEILDRFLISALGTELREYFIVHREALLSDEADRLLTYFERFYRDDPKLVQRVRERRSLLLRATTQGVDAALPALSNAQAIVDALTELLSAPDWSSRVAIARARSGILLTEEADRLLAQLLLQDSPAEVAREITGIRAMLTRARLYGFESTGFDPVAAPETLNEVQRAQMEELRSLIDGRFGEGALINVNDIERLLEEHSHLRAAWQHLRSQTMQLGSDHPDRHAVRKILDELRTLETQGDRERSLALMRQAADSPLIQQSPVLWGTLQLSLAKQLVYWPGDRAALLEQALIHARLAERALQKQNDRALWAESNWCIGGILTDRMVGARADNIEEALRRFDAAHAILQAHDAPQQRIRRWFDLAKAHMARALGSHRDNIETTLRLLRHGIDDQDFSSLDPIDRGDLLIVYGNAMMMRAAGEDADNVEAAFNAFLDARNLYAEADSPDGGAFAEYALGLALRARYYGDPIENHKQALAHTEECLRLSDKTLRPDRWARAQLNRAAILAERAATPDGAELALQSLTDAQTVLTRSSSPYEWAMAESYLGNIYLTRAHASRQPDDIQAAIRHLYAALEVFGRNGDRLHWSDLHFNLGTIHSIRAEQGAADAAVRAEEHFRLSLEERSIDVSPRRHAEVQKGLAVLLVRQGRWREAHSALAELIRAGLMDFDSAYTEVGRHEAIATLSGAFAHHAYVLLRLGRYGESLLRLDAGKTRLLAQALALANIESSNLSEQEFSEVQRLRRSVHELESRMRNHKVSSLQPMDRGIATALREARGELSNALRRIRTKQPDLATASLTLPELLSLAPAGGALVAPIVTSLGSAVFVIPHGCTEVTQQQVVHLESFKREALMEMLANLQQRSWQDMFGAIESMGARLWKGLMSKVHDALIAADVREGAPVILMPQGGLALAPMHAAWREVEGQRRYFIDDFTVSYAPSGYSLSTSLRRSKELATQATSLLAIINPTGDLDYARAEGDALEMLFGAACTALRGNAATFAAVTGRLSGYSYLHFSCHGSYCWEDATQSSLLLARDDRLRLSDVLNTLELGATRLVTLSACETGISDIRRMPDEYIGLSAGFLQAGATAVASTLWPVADISTMLLMGQFYQSHITLKEPPAAALRNAQRWLRDATNEELADYLAPYQRCTDGPTRSHHQAWQMFSEAARVEPGAQPFRHPYYWAAFVLNGV